MADDAACNAHQDKVLALVGARLDTYLLERSRVTLSTQTERNFHSFYQLLNADSKVRKRTAVHQKTFKDFKWLCCDASVFEDR